MIRLPALTYRQIVRHFRAAGFIFDRQAKGSHEIWYNRQTGWRTSVPHHTGTILRGTLRAIIRSTGLSLEQFLASGGQ